MRHDQQYYSLWTHGTLHKHIKKLRTIASTRSTQPSYFSSQIKWAGIRCDSLSHCNLILKHYVNYQNLYVWRLAVFHFVVGVFQLPNFVFVTFSSFSLCGLWLYAMRLYICERLTRVPSRIRLQQRSEATLARLDPTVAALQFRSCPVWGVNSVTVVRSVWRTDPSVTPTLVTAHDQLTHINALHAQQVII